jgi:hypothetical protein
MQWSLGQIAPVLLAQLTLATAKRVLRQSMTGLESAFMQRRIAQRIRMD